MIQMSFRIISELCISNNYLHFVAVAVQATAKYYFGFEIDIQGAGFSVLPAFLGVGGGGAKLNPLIRVFVQELSLSSALRA